MLSMGLFDGKERMDLRQIKQFMTVARHQSMTVAAKELGVSQPSLSQSIKKLESSLGVSLFNRDGRSLVLNEYGKILLAQSEIAIRSIDNAVKEINDTIGAGQHKIRLIARCPIGNSAKVFKKYHESHPDIIISCLTPSESASEEEYDIELLATSGTLAQKNCLPVCEEEYIVCVPKRHKLAKQNSVALKDLANEHFIISAASSEMNTVEKKMFEEAGFKPKVRGFFSYYGDIMRAVEQGLGICIATEITWLIGTTWDVVPLRLTDVKRSRNIFIKWPTQAYLSESSLGLVSYICGEFRAFADEQKLLQQHPSHVHFW